MKVHFVGAGPGDPDLLTCKAARILADARICIYAGSLVSAEVLAVVPRAAERHDSAGMSLDEVLAVYRDALARDIDVVRLHSGEPAIYGAIAEQMEELDRLGIDYDVVPGISSFQAAAAALCAELTIPDVSQTVILTRAAGRTPVPEHQRLERIAPLGATLCLFLSAAHLEDVRAALAPHYGADCPAAVVFHASRPDQRLVRTTLAGLPEAGVTKTAMVIVGRALSRGGTRSRLYDATFSHGYREATRE
jgi:precorrin-4/cobalt-precorrin-4 C11-methyltransferase